MGVKHAIIAVAGYGSRRLPVTKAVDKCLLPVLNRPVIDYVVQDCIGAGIEHIVLVVSEDGKKQIESFFGRNENLENYLKEHGKEDYLPMVEPPKNVEIEYVVQPADVPYGTVTPIALARPSIPEGERALILMGDDFFYTEDKSNPIKKFVEEVPEGAAALTTKVEQNEVSKYGILVADDDGNLQYSLEKPQPEESPSTMISTAKSIFTSELLDETLQFYNEPATPGKEKYFNLEPYSRYMEKGSKIKVVEAQGTYLDTGTLENWLKTNMYVAKAEGIEVDF